MPWTFANLRMILGDPEPFVASPFDTARSAAARWNATARPIAVVVDSKNLIPGNLMPNVELCRGGARA